jgi:hypothetical protein
VVLAQAAKIDGIENVAVQNEPGRGDFLFFNHLQQSAQALRLAITTTQMNVRKNDGVERFHQLRSHRAEWLELPPESNYRTFV